MHKTNHCFVKAELNPRNNESKMGLSAFKTPFLMLKHTPKYSISKATTLLTRYGGSEKMAAQLGMLFSTEMGFK